MIDAAVEGEPPLARRLALLNLAAVLLCLAIGGALGLAMRAEMVGPDVDVMTAETYSRVFSLHGAVLLLGFALPAILASLGVLVVPLQVGARLAWPGLAATGLALHVLALGLLARSLWDQGPVYEPYWSLKIAVATMAASVFATALALVATVWRGRTVGRRLPLFAWACLVTAIATLLAALLVAGLGLGWQRGLAAIHGLALVPAIGVVCEVVGVQALRGAVAAAIGVLAVVALPGWEMQADAALVRVWLGLAAGLMVLCAWIGPVVRAGLRVGAARLYALAAVSTLALAGLTGFVSATLAIDVHLRDTWFTVGSFHLRMHFVVLALLAGVHHWWPRWTERRFSEGAGRIGALVLWAGVTTQGLASLVLGHQGMPRRYYVYLPEYVGLHRAVSVGALLVGAGLAWTAIYLLLALVRRPRDPA